jgi:hypothetical protein
MKALIGAVAALGLGGAYWFSGDSPDFERVIDRPPMAVYAAFSQVAQSGPVTARGENGFAGRTVARVRKERGELIHYEVLDEDGTTIMTADLHFAPEGEGGQATRMTAELDVDTEAMGADRGGTAAMALTETIIDYSFAVLMTDLAREVEKGRPLQPLRLTRMFESPAPPPRSPEQRLREARRAQNAAVRPMTEAAPMVDPNQAARDHIRGSRPSGSGWSH